MAYIKRLPKKARNFYSNKRKRNKTEKEKLRVRLYNNKKWKALRSGYLISHPLCEVCLDEGKVTPATDVHHINSPFDDGLDEAERIGRLLSPTNIMALCRTCHGRLHYNKQLGENYNGNKNKIKK